MQHFKVLRLYFLTLSLLAQLSSVLTIGHKYLIVAKDDHQQSYVKSERDELRRYKRDVIDITANENSSKPITNVTELKAEHTQMLIDWVGKGSHVVVSLTRENKDRPQTHSSVFISYDYGANFQNKSDLFVLGNDTAAVIANFYKNAKFTSRFIFTDTLHRYLFVTLDYGRTVWPHKLDFTPSDVITHPTDASTIIVHDAEDTSKKLWASVDFGETWHVLEYRVRGYLWSGEGTATVLYVQREDSSGTSAVLAYSNFSPDASGSSNLPRRVISDVEEFDVKEEFLFAVKKVHLLGSKTREPRLQLWISHNGGPFLRAVFSHNLPHQQYYVPHVSQGQVMVCVAHDSVTSHLYVSSVPQSPEHEVRFSLSLPRIFYYQPNATWHNSWIDDVEEKAFADLHPVAGVRGVLIASQVSANYTRRPHGTVGPQHLTTLITFDLGGQWQPVQPPKTDALGNIVQCEEGSGCSLHLSQQFARLYPNTQSETILSVPSAPGIVLATGTIGSSLKGKTSVFLSTNAGFSWCQVLQGNFLYVMCDHGGLILAVENFRSEGETDSLLYSTDEGKTWHSYQFSEKPMRIYGLKTEPGENSTVVLLFGSREGDHEWVVFKVDLQPVFHGQCTKDDYKTWSPSDSLTNLPRCLLGRSEVFERRAPRANCYNGFDYDRPVSVENCPCARQDYECDYGYVASKDTHQELKDSLGKPVDVLAKDGAKALINKDAAWLHPALREQTCILDTSDTVSQTVVSALEPAPAGMQPLCKEGSFYNRSRGYRKIPGDTCHGGQDYVYEPQLTPCPLFEEQEFLLVSSRQSVLRYDLLKPEAGLQPLPLTGLSMVIAFDFDMASNCLYWADVLLNKIMRSCFDGAHGQEVIVESGTQRVEGLALDWVSLNLYLVDGASKTISAVKLPPRPTKQLAAGWAAPPTAVLWKTLLDKTVLHRPRGIALHPVQGLMFFTDWSGTNPMVARANLDGSKLQVLFGKGIVGWPNGITIDFEADRIFFVDARLDFVASSDFGGQNLHKLTTAAERPFAVAVHKSLVYWDDTSARQVLRADKNHGWGVTPINNSSIKGLVDLKIYGTWSQKGSNACGGNSSLCPYLCVGLPNGDHACLCPDDMKNGTTADASTCLCSNGTAPHTPGGTCPPSTPSCGNHRFSCSNGRCVPAQWRCDGADDCGDNTDEAGCRDTVCHSASWQCGSGQCILSTWHCDHDKDCDDGSDEQDCQYPLCNDQHFRCDNQRCISLLLHCDREDDCKDGSDERDCRYSARPACSRTDFRCASDGACLPETWRCDGDRDCADGSDETDCGSHQCHEDRLFQCSSRQCIVRSFACDGEPDCEDGSDEVNCNLTTTLAPGLPVSTIAPPPATDKCNSSLMFRCQVGHCVPLWWRCDGLDDCGDNSDEANCRLPLANSTTPPPTTSRGKGCALDQFECGEGGKAGLGPICLWESAVCDGERDCPDGEDELNCSQHGPCAPHPDSINTTSPGVGEAEASFFRCLRSEGCFLTTMHCDGQRDCADGSDEEGCKETPSPPPLSCPSGQFLCDGGDCHPESRLCDKALDCLDHEDEEACSHQLNHHLLLNLVLVTNTSVSVRWRVEGATQRTFANGTIDAVTNSAGLQFLPAIIVQAALGNPAAWHNASDWTQDTSYTFTQLVPATPYLVRVFIRKLVQDGQPPSAPELALNTINVSTYQGVPSPPLSVVAEQRGQQVRVMWQRPAQPNGLLQTYTVWLSPPSPAQQVVVGGQMTEVTVSLAAQLHHGQNISLWVTANTIDFRSAASEEATLSYVVLPPPANLRRDQMDETSAEVAWDAVEGAVGYSVSHTRPENEFLTGRVTMRTADTSAKLAGLSPGLVYVVEVRAVGCSGGGDTSSHSAGKCCAEAADVVGPLAVLTLTTTGRPLESVTHLSAELNKGAPTTVRLSWRAPLYTGDVEWQYSVLWGNSGNDFRGGLGANNTALTPNTWFEVHGLHACEAYLLAVMVAKPLGYGPAVQVQVMTGEDELAPPQRVTTSVANLTMTVRWQRPCTLARVGQDRAAGRGASSSPAPTADEGLPASYFLLLVTETTRNKTSRVAVPGTPYSDPSLGDGWLQHALQVEYGGHYEVQVRGAAEGARLSHPSAKAVAPPLPPPRQLTFTPTDSSFHWRNGPGLPQEALLSNYSYILFLRAGADCSEDTKEGTIPWEPHPVHRPPHPCLDLLPGRLYCAAVAFKTQLGYLSSKSQIIRVEVPQSDALMVFPQSVVGVTVAVVVVVIGLVLVVAVLAFRHRRLARSFLGYANSRYSHERGTTSLSANDHNLEDEDSPVIQGFSDDEPLVIA